MAFAPAVADDGSENRTARGQAFHQHAPAVADHGLTADHPLHGDEHVGAPVGSIREGGAGGQVAAADVDAGVLRRNECDGDADVLGVADDLVRIEETERETDGASPRAQA